MTKTIVSMSESLLNFIFEGAVSEVGNIIFSIGAERVSSFHFEKRFSIGAHCAVAGLEMCLLSSFPVLNEPTRTPPSSPWIK